MKMYRAILKNGQSIITVFAEGSGPSLGNAISEQLNRPGNESRQALFRKWLADGMLTEEIRPEPEKIIVTEYVGGGIVCPSCGNHNALLDYSDHDEKHWPRVDGYPVNYFECRDCHHRINKVNVQVKVMDGAGSGPSRKYFEIKRYDHDEKGWPVPAAIDNPTYKIPAGWLLLSEKPANEIDKHLSVVLCKRDEFMTNEFVTWIYNHDLGGCVHGHYHSDIDEAIGDFNSRS